MSGFDPTVDEIMSRIWAASRELHRARGMRAMDIDDLHIVVSEQIWHKILSDERLRSRRGYLPVLVEMTDRWVEDGPIGYDMKIFGTPAKPSKDLEPHEIRLRVEVSA